MCTCGVLEHRVGLAERGSVHVERVGAPVGILQGGQCNEHHLSDFGQCYDHHLGDFGQCYDHHLGGLGQFSVEKLANFL
jgi:hypothetical protein